MNAKIGKVPLALTIATGAACLALSAGIILLASSQIANAERSYADNNMKSQMDLVIDYKAYKDAYELLSAKKPVGTTPAVVIQGSVDSQKSQEALEAAGLNKNNVTTDVDGVRIYIIQPGDTLCQLSAAFGYSVDELANYNQIRDVNLIYSNSALRIPKD